LIGDKCKLNMVVLSVCLSVCLSFKFKGKGHASRVASPRAILPRSAESRSGSSLEARRQLSGGALLT